MKLDYGTQLSYAPIKLSIGTIRKPTLADIADITFNVFEHYESLMKLTPEFFLSQINVDGGGTFWEMLSDEEKNGLTMIGLISLNEYLRKQYEQMFNFFFVERVIFQDQHFAILSGKSDEASEYEVGAIDETNFDDVKIILEQICCIDDKKASGEKPKFKNKKAQEIYEKINKAPKSAKKADFNYTIPNLISSVSAMHNSINITNVWSMTVFQLLDQFNRLTNKKIYEIECTRVSVWGDEKKKFDAAAWYKNEFDKK